MAFFDRFRKSSGPAAGPPDTEDAAGAPPGPAPSAPGSGERQMADNAVTCTMLFADAWRVDLDFSPGSLRAVDDVLQGYHEQFAATGEMAPGSTVPLVDAYVQEVARKRFGGEYVSGNEANPVVLLIGDDASSVAVLAREKVLGRIVNGSEDSLSFYFDGIEPALRRPGRTVLT